MKNLEAHNQALEKLLFDKNFIELEKAMRTKATLFDIFSIYSENRVSEFIAWLLAPYEFHALGTKFIKSMLNATQADWEVFQTYTPNSGDYNELSANDFALRFEEGTIVHTEYQVTAGSRIDIAVINPTSKSAIFVENKVWVGEYKQQTKKYAKDINEKFKSYEIVYIYLDYNGGTAKSDYFYSLDYDWVKDFIEANSANRPNNAKDAMLAFKTNFWGEGDECMSNHVSKILEGKYNELFEFLNTVDQEQINNRLQRAYKHRGDKRFLEIDKFLYQHWLAWWYIWTKMK